MFLSHFAVALAAKRAAPRTSLGTLVAAAQAIDLAWPVLVLGGVERVRVAPGDTAFTPLAFEHYPWTHGGLSVVAWAALLVALYRWRTGYRAGAWAVAAAVASHWILDLVAHRPDLPLWPPAGPCVGLGLWGSVPATLLVELGLFAAGVVAYATGTRARDGVGRWAPRALVAFLLVVFAANALSPPPPSAAAVAGGALAMWLFVPWAAWADRHREARAARERHAAATAG
jgi:hypothetical protein